MKHDQIPAMSQGMQYQLKVYLEGTQGKKPALPVAFEALEARARASMPAEAFDYIAGGAGAETTMANNLRV